MKLLKHFAGVFFLFSLLILLGSCLGLKLNIVINSNGPGTIDLEYRISKSLDSLGSLDGNERWPPIPAGRADFERTLDRLPGMRLLSFNANEDDRDIIRNVKMEFENIQALLAFLDAGGQRTSFSGDSNRGSLKLVLSKGEQLSNPALIILLGEVFNDYSFNLSMTFPNGRTETRSFSINEILTSNEEITMEFSW